MSERWKSVIGYHGYYEISDHGRVKSLERIIIYDNVIRKIKERFLKPGINRKGYVVYYLSKNGSDVTITAHKLVAMCFILNPFGLPQVNHKDGNKTNNYYENLEWCTNSQNTQHAYDTGLKKKRYGKEADAAKYKYLVYKDGVLVDSLCGTTEIQNKGYQPSLIYQCIKGLRDNHKGCTFIQQSL